MKHLITDLFILISRLVFGAIGIVIVGGLLITLIAVAPWLLFIPLFGLGVWLIGLAIR